MSQHVIVYGGRGALGSTIVSFFRSKSWHVTSIDLVANDEANANVVLGANDGFEQQAKAVDDSLANILKGTKVDAVLCVAGGWAGGNAASPDLVKNTELMIKQSVWTSVISAQIASRFLAPNGFLALTGAQPALHGTPGMIGYGLAKGAVHQLVKSLAAPSGGLPAGAAVLAVLPVTIDTPMNRKFMPDSDFGTWTPREELASQFFAWASKATAAPNGALLQVITKQGVTVYVPTD